MPAIDDLMQTVESHEFGSSLNAVSDYRAFLKSVLSDETVQNLRVSAALGDRRERLMIRVQELAELSVDSRYENPWDVALAVYTTVLHSENEVAGRMAALKAREAPSTWWAPRIVEEILETAKPVSGSGSVSDETEKAVWVTRFHTSEGDALIQTSPIQNARVSRLIGTSDSIRILGSGDSKPWNVRSENTRMPADAGSARTDDVETVV